MAADTPINIAMRQDEQGQRRPAEPIAPGREAPGPASTSASKLPEISMKTSVNRIRLDRRIRAVAKFVQRGDPGCQVLPFGRPLRMLFQHAAAGDQVETYPIFMVRVRVAKA